MPSNPGGFVTTENASPVRQQAPGRLAKRPLRAALIDVALVFLVCYFILFLGLSRHPYTYDEGLVLTAAMRVAAGQIPHRDFYANYGPGQFYVLAGLFKLFGQSLLIERLFDLLIKSLLVTLMYAVAASYCRRWIAACASILSILWLIGLHDLVGTPVIPVSLLNLIALALILPLFSRNLSAWRMLAAGAVAGLGVLFRYDTGIALFGIQVCVIAIAIYLRSASHRLSNTVSALWPLLLGFATVTLPPALYFLSVAPLGSFIHDLIVYPAKYYRRNRNLPFPGIYFKGLENLEVYLPIVLAVLSLYLALGGRSASVGKSALRSRDVSENLSWRGFLITFGLLTAVMYLKGFVRVGLSQMYLSIIPSLLLLAVLLQNILGLRVPGRISVICLASLSVVAGTWAAVHQTISLYRYQVSVPSSARLGIPAIQDWCKTKNPLTKGFCFLPDEARIQTIEFIDSHTRPNQELYVGTTKHDRIFANDNIIYFGAQRLPATHWSHFDPGLQNSYEIQAQMVDELNSNAPPYIVLDSEFDGIREPNDSSRSTGVTLLDEYIHDEYQHIGDFGDMAIWQRVVTSPGS
jgi:hypothetical protein